MGILFLEQEKYKKEQELENKIKANLIVDLTEQHPFYLKLINKIKQIRKREKVTIKEIAKELNISPTTYQNFEKGRGNINLVLFMRILDLFEISLSFKEKNNEKN